MSKYVETYLLSAFGRQRQEYCRFESSLGWTQKIKTEEKEKGRQGVLLLHVLLCMLRRPSLRLVTDDKESFMFKSVAFHLSVFAKFLKVGVITDMCFVCVQILIEFCAGGAVDAVMLGKYLCSLSLLLKLFSNRKTSTICVHICNFRVQYIK